jgi:hypothetical protein
VVIGASAAAWTTLTISSAEKPAARSRPRATQRRKRRADGEDAAKRLRALEAAYKYLLICSVGIALAFIGTVLVYYAFGGLLHAAHGMLYGLAPAIADDAPNRWLPALPIKLALALLVLTGLAWPPGLAGALDIAAQGGWRGVRQPARNSPGAAATRARGRGRAAR